MTRALVTGAAGFIGAHLVRALERSGVTDVVGIGRRAAGNVATWIQADAMATGGLDDAVGRARPDEVYHLIGATRGTDDEIAQSNVETARRLLGAVRAHAPGASVVLVGSAAEYGAVPEAKQPVAESWAGAPVSAYGRAKRAVTGLATEAARAGLRVAVARPFNVVGAGVPETLVTGAVARRLRDALAGPAPRIAVVGDTTAIRDWVDAADTAEALIAVARRGVSGEVYNVCTGTGATVASVVEMLRTLAGGGVTIESRPGLSRAGDVPRMVGSPAKLVALGWRPTRDLASSLRDVWAGAAVASR